MEGVRVGPSKKRSSRMKSTVLEKEKKIGKYKIQRTLGSGASCKVKLGYDTVNRRKVAVKILHRSLEEELLQMVMKGAKQVLDKVRPHRNLI